MCAKRCRRAFPVSLEEGNHDVVIMPIPVQRRRAGESVPLFREPLYLASPRRIIPLAAQMMPVERKDLRGQSILTLESGHQLARTGRCDL